MQHHFWGSCDFQHSGRRSSTFALDGPEHICWPERCSSSKTVARADREVDSKSFDASFCPHLWTKSLSCPTPGRFLFCFSPPKELAKFDWWSKGYNSLFFSIYQFAGMFGNILASIILLSLGEVAWARNVLFVTLGVLALLGAFIFLAMPTVEGANDKQSGLLDTSRLAFTDAKVGLMIPLMVTNGMTLAFFLGDFQTDITCPVAGSGFTGFVIATFFGVNAVASASWGRLISTGTLSRRVVFFLAALLVALFLFLKTTWQAPSNYQLPAGSKDWIKIAEPRALEIAYVFVLSGIFAIGDSFFECGPPMTLQSFYAGSSSLVPAMANYKLWQSLGFAIQFFIAIPLKPHPELRGVSMQPCSVTFLSIWKNIYVQTAIPVFFLT